MKRWLKPPTFLWMVVALGATAVVHTERSHDNTWGGFVSTRSSARRVFPRLADADPSAATVRLLPAAGTEVAIEPVPGGGHQLRVGKQVVGPADPRAVEGLWASLRMATTLRAVPEDVEIGVARKGTIEVEFGGATSTVVLGAATSDGAGLLGMVAGPGFEGDEGWVLEGELGEILAQAPEAWLSRRVRPEDPAEISRLAFSDETTLVRGEDGRWRSTLGGSATDASVTALLSTDAVDARLGRLLGARLSPMLPDLRLAEAGTASKWIEAETTTGSSWSLGLGDACPDGSARTIVVRGPGWPGCLDALLTQPWPLPGRADTSGANMLEPALVPYGYGRVLRIEYTLPQVSSLRRRAGNWTLASGTGEGQAESEIEGPQVFEWYESLRTAEVEVYGADLDLDLGGGEPPVWTTAFTVSTDSTQQLRVRCGQDEVGETVCQRDDGVLLRLRTRGVALTPGAETFADRTLATMSREDIRSIEVTGSDAVRQSVHFDLGVWRLDAPAHPEGDLALSEVYLEDLLTSVSSLRVNAWSARPDTAPSRVIRVEQAAAAGGDTVTTIELWRDTDGGCRGAVGEPVGALSPATCQRLFTDLLHDDPVQAWVDTARSLELEVQGAAAVRFERTTDGLVTRTDDAEAAAAALAVLRRLASRRATGLVPAPGSDEPATPGASITVLPKRGERLEVSVSADESQLRIVGQPWAYLLSSEP